MHYVKLALMTFLIPFMALAGFIAAAVALCAAGAVLRDNYEYFSPEFTREPQHVLGGIVSAMGAILGALTPWPLLHRRRKTSRPDLPAEQPAPHYYLRVALRTVSTPFTALAGYVVAAMALSIPGLAWHNSYEYFAPGTGEPRHILGGCVCCAGFLLGALTPWFTTVDTTNRTERRAE